MVSIAIIRQNDAQVAETINLLNSLLANHHGVPCYNNLMASRYRPFATYDKDNKVNGGALLCASYWQSGWWMDVSCRDFADLNAPMVYDIRQPYLKGVQWNLAGQKTPKIIETIMMIRPTWFTNYPNQVPGFCSNSSQFDCGGGQCILFQKVRDCTKDCPDGSDENCGTGLVLCDTVLASSGCGKCVQAGSESAYCQDQRYASLCSLPQNQRYQCTSTRNCVLNNWLMDGVNECDPCLLNRTTCDSTSVCTFNTYTLKVICDCPAGVSVGGTSCTYVDPLVSKIPGKCLINPLQFDCGDKCIDIKQFRDCRSDCSDGSDESCWLGTSKCSDACTCVPTGTENSNCPISAGQSICQLRNTTKCALTSICVYNEWIMDGKNDCGDYSDEAAVLNKVEGGIEIICCTCIKGSSEVRQEIKKMNLRSY
uniref:Fibrinogen C-terminal domain-containing protein n=1 Tax=Romanomermis culicivorax TaxID=13658 RepID=A0A915IS96_ROMCU